MKHTLFDGLVALLAFAVLAGFLGILVWYVPRLDLGAVIAITLIFVAWDFFFPRHDQAS